jgi:hypothetical protein
MVLTRDMFTTQVLPNGNTVGSAMLRPYLVVTYVPGTGRTERHFGSLAAAERAARGNCVLFFEYQTGCGHFLSRSGG